MFDDIDLFTMLNIAGRVAADNWEIFCPYPYERDAGPAASLTLNTLPDGEDFLRRPVQALYPLHCLMVPLTWRTSHA
jgi:hypothetical protein